MQITNSRGIFSELLPISYEKYADLQELKQFCGQDARNFYCSLPHNEPKPKANKRKLTNQKNTKKGRKPTKK